MRVLNAVLFTFALVSPLAASASILMTIQGKVTSITESDYLVDTKTAIYYISRHKISPDQAEKIKGTDVDVALTVAPEAIDLVKKKPKTSKADKQ